MRKLKLIINVIKRLIGRGVFEISAADSVFLIFIYALGSYFIFDFARDLGIFLIFLLAYNSKRPALRNFYAFSLLTGLAVLLATTIAFLFVDRYTTADFNLRLFHMFGGRAFLLILIPYLFNHAWISITGRSASYRVVSRLALAAGKLSLYLGAFIAIMTMSGGAIWVHTLLSIIALVALAWHIIISRGRRDPADKQEAEQLPFRFGASPSWIYPVAAMAGVAICFVVATQDYIGRRFNIAASYSETVSERTVVTAPSPAKMSGEYYQHEQILGQSANCGVDGCHFTTYADWAVSAHRNSAGEKYRAELEQLISKEGVPSARICAGCHDPISLFSGKLHYGESIYAVDGEREGISCLACHCLAPIEGVAPANGALKFTYPEFYTIGPLSNYSIVSLWDEHIDNFSPPEFRDPRLCVACHRFAPPEDEKYRRIYDDWLTKDYHRQEKMKKSCLGDQECATCHMPRNRQSTRPGPARKNHLFKNSLTRIIDATPLGGIEWNLNRMMQPIEERDGDGPNDENNQQEGAK